MAQTPQQFFIQWKGTNGNNFWAGREGESVAAICDHIMQGTQESSDGWFKDAGSEVSAHFGVAKDGRIWQWVDMNNRAWANGIPESPDTSVPFIADAINRKKNPNDFTVSIEHEGDTGDTMPEAQYQATLWLHRHIMALYPAITPDRNHIVGHYQISAKSRPNCPGSSFPWTRLINDLANGEVSHVANEQPSKPAANVIQMNGFVLGHGMKTYWDKVAVPGVQHPLGLPLSEEMDYTTPDGKKLVIQIFERAVLGFDISIEDPAYRTQGLIIGPEWVANHLKAA